MPQPQQSDSAATFPRYFSLSYHFLKSSKPLDRCRVALMPRILCPPQVACAGNIGVLVLSVYVRVCGFR